MSALRQRSGHRFVWLMQLCLRRYMYMWEMAYSSGSTRRMLSAASTLARTAWKLSLEYYDLGGTTSVLSLKHSGLSDFQRGTY